MPPRLGREVVEFGRTIRLAHSLFALPFALGTAFLAESVGGEFPASGAGGFAAGLALIVACMVTARTAAMGMNRVADARLDADNPRTAGRAIPAGRLRRGTALALALASGAAFVACAWGFLPLRGNPWPGLLAPAFLAALLGYAYTKRFTALSHWALGLCLGLAPVGVWIALRGEVAVLPLAVGAAVAFWTAGFDILYALQDEAFDREAGLHSVPAVVGRARAMRVALGSHVVALGFLAAAYAAGAPREGEKLVGVASLSALAAVAVLVAAQHGRAARIDADATLEADEKARRIAGGFFPWNAAVGIVWMAGAIVDAAW